MNRLGAAVGLCVVLAACGPAPATRPPDSAVPTTQAAGSETEAVIPGPTALTDDAGAPIPVVAYDVCKNADHEPRSGCRTWVVNADGSFPRQLVPPERDPEKRRYDVPDTQYLVGWSADGSRLYFRFERMEPQTPTDAQGVLHTGLAVTDAIGSRPVELIDVTREWKANGDPMCPAPVEDDNCQANVEDSAISPDGTRLAYPILEGRDLNNGMIVILDLASGQINRVESTRVQNPGSGPNETLLEEPCATKHSQGENRSPSWSPDGTRLVFGRETMGPRVNGFCQSTIITVNADGSDLRRLVGPEVPALHPRWSPDGSTIVFHTSSAGSDDADVHTVHPDGGGLVTLTSDGRSMWPEWTRDGRIAFITGDLRQGSLTLMDADGGNKSPINTSIPAFTAAGCVICAYPDNRGEFWNAGGLNLMLWQPLPSGQP